MHARVFSRQRSSLVLPIAGLSSLQLLCNHAQRTIGAFLFAAQLLTSMFMFFTAAHKGVVSLPAPVEGLTGLKIKSIAAGAFHSGCVDADGNVYVWGHGAYGQLGLGTYHHYHQPHQVMNVWCLMR